MKNFVFISPNFPSRYYLWCESLAHKGVRVLGIGDTPYEQTEPRLKSALTEFVFVPDMNRYEDMEKALKGLVQKYGPIDGLESNNEWWLPLDARLREEFHIPGLKPRDLAPITSKSQMKALFQKGGAKVIRSLLISSPADLEKAKEFAEKVGYPLFCKPDVGVGAVDSHRIDNEEALERLLFRPLPVPHLLEEFVSGRIVSFDGICDQHSDCVFITSDHFPTPIADVVNQGIDYYYYNNPFSLPMKDIDAASFEKVGRNVVKAFGIQKRFFHIEFFVLDQDKPGLAKKGEFVALECNMRAPGGDTPDLINFGSSCSVYDIYADVFLDNPVALDPNAKPYYAFATHRRDETRYAHSLDEVLEKYGPRLSQWGRYPKAIAGAMCDLYFDGRFENFEDGLAFDQFVREKA